MIRLLYIVRRTLGEFGSTSPWAALEKMVWAETGLFGPAFVLTSLLFANGYIRVLVFAFFFTYGIFNNFLVTFFVYIYIKSF